MKKITRSLSFLLSLFLFFSCSTESAYTDDPTKGEILVVADESVKPLVDAEIQGYETEYPNAKINVKYVPEQIAINLMLKDSARVAIVTRELNEKELKVFKDKEIPYTPAIMAVDGVTLITNRANTDTLMTVNELKKIFNGEIRKDTKLIFDNSNSSNLNYLVNKLGIKDVNQANIFAAKGNLDVFESVKNNPHAIGVIGSNWISDTDDKNSVDLRNSIRVISISAKDNPTIKDYYKPTFTSLTQRKYPLERYVYLHTKEARWGLGKGFIRYACFQVGQIIVEKMGLLPYYKFPREIQLEKKPLTEKKE